MARQTTTEVKLEFICKEIKELKDQQNKLREDINKGKGAIWLLLVISGIVAGAIGYFKQ
jgi:hypothetical protein